MKTVAHLPQCTRQGHAALQATCIGPGEHEVILLWNSSEAFSFRIPEVFVRWNMILDKLLKPYPSRLLN